VFTAIKMDSIGSFMETTPQASYVHSFGAQVIEIKNF